MFRFDQLSNLFSSAASSALSYIKSMGEGELNKQSDGETKDTWGSIPSAIGGAFVDTANFAKSLVLNQKCPEDAFRNTKNAWNNDDCLIGSRTHALVLGVFVSIGCPMVAMPGSSMHETYMNQTWRRAFPD